MKRFLLAMFIIAASPLLMAWAPPKPPPVEGTYTEIFDSVFSVISKVDATTGIIYERVVPFANLVNYNNLK